MSNAVTTDYLDKKLDDFGLKIFKYLDKRFTEVDERFEKIEKSLDNLTSTLDAFVKRLDDMEVENTARDAQIARMERWIEQIADKTGVKLEY